MVSIVLRKSYGLGAQAMMGGSTKAPLACVAWPTGEFGGMGLEGAVRLGYRNELGADRRPGRARAHVPADGRPDVRARQGGERRRRTSRSTTSSTRPTPAAGSAPSCCAPRHPPQPHRQEAPQHRHLVRVERSDEVDRRTADRAADPILPLQHLPFSTPTSPIQESNQTHPIHPPFFSLYSPPHYPSHIHAPTTSLPTSSTPSPPFPPFNRWDLTLC